VTRKHFRLFALLAMCAGIVMLMAAANGPTVQSASRTLGDMSDATLMIESVSTESEHEVPGSENGLIVAIGGVIGIVVVLALVLIMVLRKRKKK